MEKTEPKTCGAKSLTVLEINGDDIKAVCNVCGKKIKVSKESYSKKQLSDWLGIK